MKRKDELNANNKEVETMNKKHFELAEDELGLVSGGADPYLQGSSSTSILALNNDKQGSTNVVLNQNKCDDNNTPLGPVLVNNNGDTPESSALSPTRYDY